MRDSPSLRIALIGAGRIASEVHLPILKKLPEFDLTGIYDSNIDRAETVASKFGISSVYRSLDELLSQKSEVVDICTPPQTHTETALECLQNGVHCIIEKPFALTVTDADSVMKTAEDNHKKVFPIQNYSFIPALQKVKRIIRKGEIGKLVNVSIRYHASFDDHRHKYFLNKEHWIHDLLGDVFADLAPHLAYMLVELIGTPTTVTAVCKNISGLPNIIGDELEVIAATEDIMGSFFLSYGSSVKLFSAEVIGTNAALRVDGNSQAVVKIHAIRDSTNVRARARQALSEILQLTGNAFSTGFNIIIGRYSPATYSHHYLFTKCAANLQHNEPYPVDLKAVKGSVMLCEKAFKQLKNQ